MLALVSGVVNILPLIQQAFRLPERGFERFFGGLLFHKFLLLSCFDVQD